MFSSISNPCTFFLLLSPPSWLYSVTASSAGAKYSENLITDMSWCRTISRVFDYQQLLRLQRSCEVSHDDILRCPLDALQFAHEAVDFALDWQPFRPKEWLCTNGLATAALIVLHAEMVARTGGAATLPSGGSGVSTEAGDPASTEAGISERDQSRYLPGEMSLHRLLAVESLLNRMVRRAFMLDASIWAGKLWMIRDYFEKWSVLKRLPRNALFEQVWERSLEAERRSLTNGTLVNGNATTSTAGVGGSLAKHAPLRPTNSVPEPDLPPEYQIFPQFVISGKEEPLPPVTFLFNDLSELAAAHVGGKFADTALVFTFKKKDAEEQKRVRLAWEKAGGDAKRLVFFDRPAEMDELVEGTKGVGKGKDTGLRKDEGQGGRAGAVSSVSSGVGENDNTVAEDSSSDPSGDLPEELDSTLVSEAGKKKFPRGSSSRKQLRKRKQTKFELGAQLNGFIESVPTELVFVVAENALPKTKADLRAMILYQAKAEVTGGQLLDGERLQR